MRQLVLAAVALVLVSGGTAVAQTPSEADIITGLKPKPGQLTAATRGIRRVKAPDAAPAEDAPSVKLTVDFATGSAVLAPVAKRTLDQLGQALASPSLAAFRFRVEGHTDTVGKPEANKALSQHRAEAVAAYLEGKFQIAAARLEAVGVGSEQLLVQTPDQTAEPGNRRVRVVNIGS